MGRSDARAFAMHRARHQLLARAAFASNQNATGGAGDARDSAVSSPCIGLLSPINSSLPAVLFFKPLVIGGQESLAVALGIARPPINVRRPRWKSQIRDCVKRPFSKYKMNRAQAGSSLRSSGMQIASAKWLQTVRVAVGHLVVDPNRVPLIR